MFLGAKNQIYIFFRYYSILTKKTHNVSFKKKNGFGPKHWKNWMCVRKKNFQVSYTWYKSLVCMLMFLILFDRRCRKYPVSFLTTLSSHNSDLDNNLSLTGTISTKSDFFPFFVSKKNRKKIKKRAQLRNPRFLNNSRFSKKSNMLKVWGTLFTVLNGWWSNLKKTERRSEFTV